MKVLYVQPGTGVGGSKISLYHILRCAPKEQVSQIVLTSPPDVEYEKMIAEWAEKIHYLKLPTWNKYRRKDIKEFIRAPFSHIQRLLSLLPVSSRLARIIKEEHIELVHTNNGISAAGAIAAFFTRRPHVWHVREAIGSKGEYPLILSDHISAYLFDRLSNVIVCNSRFTANFFQQYGYLVHIIQNGVDIERLQEPSALSRGLHLHEQLLKNQKKIVVAMVGNLTTVMKKHDLFLAVINQLNDLSKNQCIFVVFGNSSDLSQTSYTRQLKKTVSDFNLENNVIWMDYLNDVPAIMNSIDILVHPACKEGSGRVVMEAMAAGKPVIGVMSGGVQELIVDGKNGFLVPEDDLVKEMAKKVQFLLDNPLKRKEIGNTAKKTASENFSDMDSMKSIFRIYSKLGKL